MSVDRVTVRVELAGHGYPVHIGAGLLSDDPLLTGHLPPGRLMVVSNETVAPLYLGRVLETLAHRDPQALVLPDGERYKTLDTASAILDRLADSGFHRDGAILALGGGVVGDLAGFAAACYMRGIDYLQLPTTLLAQVDASVGGKTGVNHPRGKNLIGAFHQPRAVVADTNTLATLPEREYRAGLAEVVKYALIDDAPFLGWLEARTEPLTQRDAAVLVPTIERCCRNKAAIVGADEREKDQRALLNLGHTFAHALETATGYERFLHGEAVAIGLVLATRLSVEREGLAPALADRVETLLHRLGLETGLPGDLSPDRLLDTMRLDKKATESGMRLVLVSSQGRAVLRDDVPEASVLGVLADASG